jgi:hypothetical protein
LCSPKDGKDSLMKTTEDIRKEIHALYHDIEHRAVTEARLWEAFCALYGWEYRAPGSVQRVRRLGRKFRGMIVAQAQLGVSHVTLLTALRGKALTPRLAEALSGVPRREWYAMAPAARDAHVAARIAEWQSVDLRVGHGRCGDLARALRGEKR